MFRKIAKDDITTYVKYLNKLFFNSDAELFKESKSIFGCEERTFEHDKTKKTYLVTFLNVCGNVNVAIFTIHKRTDGTWYKGDHIYLSMETATRLASICKSAQVLFGKREASEKV